MVLWAVLCFFGLVDRERDAIIMIVFAGDGDSYFSRKSLLLLFVWTIFNLLEIVDNNFPCRFHVPTGVMIYLQVLI